MEQHSQLFWVFALIAIFAYFYPAWTAFTRKPDNYMGVFVLNLFLGWTFIGWVAALIWAFSGQNERRKRRLDRLNEKREMKRLAIAERKAGKTIE